MALNGRKSDTKEPRKNKIIENIKASLIVNNPRLNGL
jgi:hypothetical protein